MRTVSADLAHLDLFDHAELVVELLLDQDGFAISPFAKGLERAVLILNPSHEQQLQPHAAHRLFYSYHLCGASWLRWKV